MSYRKKESLLKDKNGVIVKKASEDAEKIALQQPVRLHPSWEDNNLPEEELNFKNLTMDDASLQLTTPKDRYHLVYLIFILHGIGVLMPWNMFITADNYFTEHKLSGNYTGVQDSPYRSMFLQYLGFASQVPNVLFNYINIFVQIGGSLTTRIVWSISVEVIIFVLTIILAMTDSSSWPGTFFGLTMASVVLLNMMNGIYQNTIFGMAAKLPQKYTGAVIIGNNICGTFTAVVSILSMLFSSNDRMAAIYYFITALFVLLLCFDTYFALPLNRFYRHHELKEQKEAQLRLANNRGVKQAIPYIRIIKQAWPQLFNVFFVFFVTLSIFPAVHANIVSPDPHFFIPPFLYSKITCFLTFNFTAMLGSLLPRYVIWPKPKFLWIPVVLRVLYIPFYLLCNYQIPERHRVLPVVFGNDWVYWTVALTMGFTSGYFSSVGMMYTPRTVDPQYAATAGMLGGAALITGIFAGILSTFIWPWFILHVGP